MRKMNANRNRKRGAKRAPRFDDQTRGAAVHVWPAGEQTARILKRRRLAYQNPAQLLAAAAALVPEWRALTVGMLLLKQLEVSLDFGTDDHGVYTRVYVTLKPNDLTSMASYLLASSHVSGLSISVDLPDDEDDDGGEELPVPRVGPAPLDESHEPPTTTH